MYTIQTVHTVQYSHIVHTHIIYITIYYTSIHTHSTLYIHVYTIHILYTYLTLCYTCQPKLSSHPPNVAVTYVYSTIVWYISNRYMHIGMK